MKRIVLALVAPAVLALAACGKPVITEVGYEWADRTTCVKETEWSDGDQDVVPVPTASCPPLPANYDPEADHEG